MDERRTKSNRFWAVLSAIGAVAALPAGAQGYGGGQDAPPPPNGQPTEGDQRRFGGPPPPGGPGRPGRMMGDIKLIEVPLDTMVAVLKLTDEQRGKIDSIVKKVMGQRRRRPGQSGFRGPGRPGIPGGEAPQDGADRPGSPGGPDRPGRPDEAGGPDSRPPFPASPGQRGDRGFGQRGGAPGRGPDQPGVPGEPPPFPPGIGGPAGRGPMGGPGGPNNPAFEKASKEIEAVLTEDQRKKAPELVKAMRSLREAHVPLFEVAKIKLTEKRSMRSLQGQASGGTQTGCVRS